MEENPYQAPAAREGSGSSNGPRRMNGVFVMVLLLMSVAVLLFTTMVVVSALLANPPSRNTSGFLILG